MQTFSTFPNHILILNFERAFRALSFDPSDFQHEIFRSSFDPRLNRANFFQAFLISILVEQMNFRAIRAKFRAILCLVSTLIQGIVSMMNKHGILQAIGYYVNGFPHGPFWFHYENIFIQTYFNQGLLDKEKRTVVVDSDERMVKIGVLKNQFLLKNAQNAKGKSGHSYLQS